MKHRATLVLALAGLAACSPAAEDAQADDADSKFLSQPLVSEIYTADPSAHVWDGKIYVYPSHDIDAGIPDDDLGSVTLAGVVPKLSATPGRLRWSGRRVGQDTRAVLKDTAGLSDAEIDRLAAAGVIYCDPKP